MIHYRYSLYRLKSRIQWWSWFARGDLDLRMMKRDFSNHSISSIPSYHHEAVSYWSSTLSSYGALQTKTSGGALWGVLPLFLVRITQRPRCTCGRTAWGVWAIWYLLNPFFALISGYSFYILVRVSGDNNSLKKGPAPQMQVHASSFESLFRHIPSSLCTILLPYYLLEP